MASVFRGALEFFYDLGIYDVVLPFLLIFTIVFAILEKTRAFGVEEVDGNEYTRKNLNAMVAFVAALLVVGSARLVAAINEAIANTMILLLLGVMFLVLAGSFHKDEEFFLKGAWSKTFMVIMFVGIVLIFLNALGFLDAIYNYLTVYWNTETISSIALLLVVAGFMAYVTSSPNKKASKED